MCYVWRADRGIQEKPEAEFIPRKLARLDTVYRPASALLLSDAEKAKAQILANQLGHKMVVDHGPMLPAAAGSLRAALLWEPRVNLSKIEIEWGFQEGFEDFDYSGRAAAWFGHIVNASVLRDDSVSEMTETAAWSPASRWLEVFLERPGALADGDFNDGSGNFYDGGAFHGTTVYDAPGAKIYELIHNGGTGRILYDLAEHYFLSGDAEWFKRNQWRM